MENKLSRILGWPWLGALLVLACAHRGVPVPPASPSSEEKPPVMGPVAEARAGYVANRMHPGDPIQRVVVAGFYDLASAAAFVEASLNPERSPPVFTQTLERGQSVRFSGAVHPAEGGYLVVFFHDEQGRPILLSLTRAHADIPLAIGSCGYQFLLNVDAAAATRPTYPLR
jgi:hypothetical protein